MKHVFLGLFMTLFGYYGQTQAGTDSITINHLVKLSELYTSNVNATGKDFQKAAKDLRTPSLDHMIETLLLLGEGDKDLLAKEFLSKPSHQELKMWYVLREIHHNRVRKDVEKRPAEEIAREVLQKDIDERFLVDNYYYRIKSGIAQLFNDKNLKRINIDLSSYGLENEAEKAMLFFHVSEAMVQRFKVLQIMKKPEKLLDFASHLPSFNGKPYYEYRDFDFEDFEYMPYDTLKSFKEEKLGNFYEYLFAHFWALTENEQREEARKLYQKSILSEPKYFKYSGMEASLEEFYSKYNG